MEKTYDVVALGELLIDFAELGYSNQGNQLFEACPGGAPCNVLAMLQKCGKKTAFIGKVGKDKFGSFLIDTVKKLNIETKGIKEDPEIPTTIAFVHTLQDGDRGFSFYRNPGADIMLSKEEIDKDLIRQAKIFHFGILSMTNEPAISATKEAISTAKQAGCLISFDPNLRLSLWKSVDDAIAAMEYGFTQCDILKISDDEIQFFSGLKDYDAGIHCLLEKYQIPLIFLTLGKHGSRAYYKGMRVEAPGYSVQTIDTTGAGDTFCGCILNAVLEYGIDGMKVEKIIKSTLQFGNAAAALVTTKKGAILSMPEICEVKQLVFVQ